MSVSVEADRFRRGFGTQRLGRGAILEDVVAAPASATDPETPSPTHKEYRDFGHVGADPRNVTQPGRTEYSALGHAPNVGCFVVASQLTGEQFKEMFEQTKDVLNTVI